MSVTTNKPNEQPAPDVEVHRLAQSSDRPGCLSAALDYPVAIVVMLLFSFALQPNNPMIFMAFEWAAVCGTLAFAIVVCLPAAAAFELMWVGIERVIPRLSSVHPIVRTLTLSAVCWPAHATTGYLISKALGD